MNWNIGRYEIQGTVHRDMNCSCQDKTFYIQRENISCIALADGAGIANYADIGANIAVKKASEYMADNFESLYEENDS